MRSNEAREVILEHLRRNGHVTLFLDYDGTMVPIAPTPAEAVPDAPLLELLREMVLRPSLRAVVLSGRPLDELESMLPVDGLLLAGLYGVEMKLGKNTLVREPAWETNRESLSELRDGWLKLAAGLTGFLLEDKGQAIALHARWADQEHASHVLSAARDLATDLIDLKSFRIVDGDRYLEVAPLSADKGETVDWLLTQFPVDGDLPVAFGDDNKDDAAFAAVRARGGIAVGVGHRYPLPEADVHVESHDEVRDWLRAMVQA